MSNDVSFKTFEDGIKELEAIVKQFEEGKFNLDEAVLAYERGINLRNHCAGKLQQAKEKIDLVVVENGIQTTGSVNSEKTNTEK